MLLTIAVACLALVALIVVSAR